MTCDRIRVALGAYVLGALEPAERQGVDTHLGGCQRCRDELAYLAALPGLLGRLTRDEAEIEPLAPTGVPLLGALATLRRRRRRMRLSVAAVAAAVVLAGGLTATLLTADRGGDRPVTASATSGTVRAAVAATARGWGTELSLQLSGVPAGTRCSLVAVSRDGQREVAGSWTATYTGRANVIGATSIPRAQLVQLDIATAGGANLVTLWP